MTPWTLARYLIFSMLRIRNTKDYRPGCWTPIDRRLSRFTPWTSQSTLCCRQGTITKIAVEPIRSWLGCRDVRRPSQLRIDKFYSDRESVQRPCYRDLGRTHWLVFHLGCRCVTTAISIRRVCNKIVRQHLLPHTVDIFLIAKKVCLLKSAIYLCAF